MILFSWIIWIVVVGLWWLLVVLMWVNLYCWIIFLVRNLVLFCVSCKLFGIRFWVLRVLVWCRWFMLIFWVCMKRSFGCWIVIWIRWLFWCWLMLMWWCLWLISCSGLLLMSWFWRNWLIWNVWWFWWLIRLIRLKSGKFCCCIWICCLRSGILLRLFCFWCWRKIIWSCWKRLLVGFFCRVFIFIWMIRLLIGVSVFWFLRLCGKRLFVSWVLNCYILWLLRLRSLSGMVKFCIFLCWFWWNVKVRRKLWLVIRVSVCVVLVRKFVWIWNDCLIVRLCCGFGLRLSVVGLIVIGFWKVWVWMMVEVVMKGLE